MGIKSVISKIRKKKRSTIVYGKEDANHYPKALQDLIKHYPELENDKLVMIRDKQRKIFDPKIEKVLLGYDLVNFEIEKYGDDSVKEVYSNQPLSLGDAIKYKPYPPCIRRIIRTCFSRSLNVYPSTIGSSIARQDLVDYLIREGFPKEDNEYCKGINVHNVAFADSTTQGFSMVLKTIARPHDVILMTAPNYGIFAEIAEKMEVSVETIALKEENKFLLDPKDLSERIDKVNKELKEEYEGKLDYVPKCVAYLNINPHNPIGNVMSIDDIDLITDIADVCLEKGVFIIDDLIYRDLTFDHSRLAFPIGTISKYFNNTISLFGLSKSYGLASFRAGFVVMPTPVFWGYATQMFDLKDSIAVLQVEAVRGAFNGSDSRYKAYDKYFNKLLPKYLYQLDLANALLNGIDVIEDESIKRKIIRDVKKYNPNPKVVNQILKGIDGIDIREGTYPQSGFFIMLDFTKLKGKYYNDQKIETEYDLLKAMYHFGKIRYLMGENIVWPYPEEMVARANFAIDKNALIHNLYQMNKLVGVLKDGPNKKKDI